MLKIGDTIKCHDAEDAAELAGELARGGTTQNLFTRRTESVGSG